LAAGRPSAAHGQAPATPKLATKLATTTIRIASEDIMIITISINIKAFRMPQLARACRSLALPNVLAAAAWSCCSDEGRKSCEEFTSNTV
jgi:hypothetical protein